MEHDAVDVVVGEYMQSGMTGPGLATYRKEKKRTHRLPEVANRKAALSEDDRPHSEVLQRRRSCISR